VPSSPFPLQLLSPSTINGLGRRSPRLSSPNQYTRREGVMADSHPRLFDDWSEVETDHAYILAAMEQLGFQCEFADRGHISRRG
jgi:hypothetical protein